MKVWICIETWVDDDSVTSAVYGSRESLTEALINDVVDLNEGSNPVFVPPTTVEEAIRIMADEGVIWTIEEKEVQGIQQVVVKGYND